jgi:hypothetical protein
MANTPPTPDSEVHVEGPLTPERYQAENRHHDGFLAGLVVLVAFLLASFPIVDPTFWLHLRTGQLIAAGQFSFGSDPFSYLSPDRYWIPAGWLSDFLFHKLHGLGGGAGLVLWRGALTALLAGLMLSVAKPGASRLLSVVPVTLAIVTVSHRLWLRPEFFSYVLLGLNLYLLWRPTPPAADGQVPGRLAQGSRYVVLPVLFALWANLDQWFVLGLLLTGLWWLGGSLRTRAAVPTDDDPTPEENRRLGLWLLASVAACLLNPAHVHVFRIPDELSSPALNHILERRAELKLSMAAWLSPWDPAQFANLRREDSWFRPLGLSISEWAYYPLVFLGLAMLWSPAARQRWPWWLAWAGFFLLSAWHARNMGFFAVVAGPLTALLWQTAWPTPVPAARPSRGALLGGQAARLAWFFVLVALGVLMVFPFTNSALASLDRPGRYLVLGLVHPRGSLGWSLWTEPTLATMASALGNRAATSQLPGRGFFLDWSDQPGYVAALGHGLQHGFDGRYGRFTAEDTRDYFDALMAIRDTGRPVPIPEMQARYQRWKSFFEKHDISYLVISRRLEVWQNPTTKRTDNFYLHDLLLIDRDAQGQPLWRLLPPVDGQTFVLAWTGSPHYPKLRDWLDRPNVAAFQTPGTPWVGANEPWLEQPTTLDRWLAGSMRPRPTGIDEAEWHRTRLVAAARAWFEIPVGIQQITAFHARVGGFLGQGMPFVGYWTCPEMLVFRLGELRALDLEPAPLTPAHAILGIQAARRALAATRDSTDLTQRYFRAAAYRYLADFYRRQYELERLVVTANNPLRDFQVLAATRQYTLLQPEDPGGHLDLARYYANRNFFDAAYNHFRQARALAGTSERGLSAGAKPRPDKVADELEKQVQNRQTAYRNNVPARREDKPSENALLRAQTALQLGLPQQAEQDLRDALAGPKEQHAVAYRMLVDLYNGLGAMPQLLELLALPDARSRLGERSYLQTLFFTAAAAGDVAAARRAAAELQRQMETEAMQQWFQTGVLQTLGGPEEPYGSQFAAVMQGQQSQQAMADLAMHVIATGLFELEAGAPAKAAELFALAHRSLDPNLPLGLVAGHYYLAITGQFLSSGDNHR